MNYCSLLLSQLGRRRDSFNCTSQGPCRFDQVTLVLHLLHQCYHLPWIQPCKLSQQSNWQCSASGYFTLPTNTRPDQSCIIVLLFLLNLIKQPTKSIQKQGGLIHKIHAQEWEVSTLDSRITGLGVFKFCLTGLLCLKFLGWTTATGSFGSAKPVCAALSKKNEATYRFFCPSPPPPFHTPPNVHFSWMQDAFM